MSFGQICQWLKAIHSQHEVMGWNPTRANYLHKIAKRLSKMNMNVVIYLGYFKNLFGTRQQVLFDS